MIISRSSRNVTAVQLYQRGRKTITATRLKVITSMSKHTEVARPKLDQDIRAKHGMLTVHTPSNLLSEPKMLIRTKPTTSAETLIQILKQESGASPRMMTSPGNTAILFQLLRKSSKPSSTRRLAR